MLQTSSKRRTGDTIFSRVPRFGTTHSGLHDVLKSSVCEFSPWESTGQFSGGKSSWYNCWWRESIRLNSWDLEKKVPTSTGASGISSIKRLSKKSTKKPLQEPKIPCEKRKKIITTHSTEPVQNLPLLIPKIFSTKIFPQQLAPQLSTLLLFCLYCMLHGILRTCQQAPGFREDRQRLVVARHGPARPGAKNGPDPRGQRGWAEKYERWRNTGNLVFQNVVCYFSNGVLLHQKHVFLFQVTELFVERGGGADQKWTNLFSNRRPCCTTFLPFPNQTRLKNPPWVSAVSSATGVILSLWKWFPAPGAAKGWCPKKSEIPFPTTLRWC